MKADDLVQKNENELQRSFFSVNTISRDYNQTISLSKVKVMATLVPYFLGDIEQKLSYRTLYKIVFHRPPAFSSNCQKGGGVTGPSGSLE